MSLRRNLVSLLLLGPLTSGGCGSDADGIAEKPVPGDAGQDASGGTAGQDAGGTCQSGESRPCYTGPPATQGVGRCSDGVQTCSAGTFGACEGEVLPEASELCDGQVDDNCNGLVDEGCACQPSETRPCYTGPMGTQGVGPCGAGTQSCVSGQWASDCTGQTLPTAETCNDIDDNCNGTVDDATGLRLFKYTFASGTWSNEYLTSAWSGPNAPPCQGIAAATKLTDIDRTLVFGEGGTLYWRKGTVWQPPEPLGTRFSSSSGTVDSVNHLAHSWAQAWDPSAPFEESITITKAPNYQIYRYLPNDSVLLHSTGTMTAEAPPGPNQLTSKRLWVFEKLDLSLLGTGAAYEFYGEYDDGHLYLFNAAAEWTKWTPAQSPLLSKPGAPPAQTCVAAFMDHATQVATLICP